jgi:hypothetical protein
MSCLDYVLQDHATIPPDLGIFLSTTWRMHPDVCRFISGAVYEDWLEAEPHTARRRIVPVDGACIRRDAGIEFVPVRHEGNRQGSEESHRGASHDVTTRPLTQDSPPGPKDVPAPLRQLASGPSVITASLLEMWWRRGRRRWLKVTGRGNVVRGGASSLSEMAS